MENLDLGNFSVEYYVVVYTKGSCRGNGGINAIAGIGVWFGENHSLNVQRRISGRATNHIADIQACVHAVEIAYENGIRNLKIKTDCRYVINAMNKWIHVWKTNGWKKTNTNKDVRNKEDFIELDDACQRFDVVWELVKRKENPACKLARNATSLQ
ncbi:hypothetical protein ILUMI_15500 [Ignelater luminosus]|uniref:RNase H type-1 domain-containing protein n=1 Tax=Ignelater luminosus TaxID=2038154 RepID=A0A8K0CTZ2_IGNLU|nr:hypothetical protein ILUMI_15500 [Ignelater luminosus]